MCLYAFLHVYESLSELVCMYICMVCVYGMYVCICECVLYVGRVYECSYVSVCACMYVCECMSECVCVLCLPASVGFTHRHIPVRT